MRACWLCGIITSAGRLMPAWDKYVQAWIDHWVRRDCERQAWEAYQRRRQSGY